MSGVDVEVERLVERFEHRRRIIIDAEAEGLIDYLTCPACRALVPIPGDASWPDACPRCKRCIGC